MRVRPFRGLVEVRVAALENGIGIWKVLIPEAAHDRQERRERSKRFDRDLDIDDGLRDEPGHGGRAHVLDSAGKRAEGGAQCAGLVLESRAPDRIIGNQLNHSRHTPSARLPGLDFPSGFPSTPMKKPGIAGLLRAPREGERYA